MHRLCTGKKRSKKPKSEVKRLKTKLWKLVSEYIRRRDNGVCFTCGVKKHWKEMHCGHWKHGRLDYDEMNLNCQCVSCNKFHHGRLDVYTMKLIEKYGKEEVDLLEQRANQVKIYTCDELRELISTYKQALLDFNKSSLTQ